MAGYRIQFKLKNDNKRTAKHNKYFRGLEMFLTFSDSGFVYYGAQGEFMNVVKEVFNLSCFRLDCCSS